MELVKFQIAGSSINHQSPLLNRQWTPSMPTLIMRHARDSRSCVRRSGGPPAGRVPDPIPGAGDVLVRIHAIGVNPYDTYMRSGAYAIRPDLPYIPGADAAGVIEHVGHDVSGLAIGDRVYICGTSAHRAYGAYASLAVCHPPQTHPLANRLSFAQGAAVGIPYVTAWRAVFDRAQAQPGETMLVHGASGAVGLAAVQIGHAAG